MGIKYKNNAITTITSDIDDEITTIPVSNAAVFPELGENDYCYLTIGEGNINMEIVKVTAIVGNNLTVVREQQGTVARSFLSGAPIELRLTAGMLQAGFDEVAAFASSETSSAASSAQSNAISSSNGYTDTSISNLSLGTASQATVGTGDTHLPTVATVNTKIADGVKINTLAEKTTLVDNDLVGGEDSASDPVFSRIKIKCLAIFNYIKSKFGFDFDATTLTAGKTFQVVEVGGGVKKIQQVDFPTPEPLKGMNYTRQTSNYTANPYDFVVMDSTSARTVTFPANADLVGGEEIAVHRQNTGTVTVTAGSGSTIEGSSTESIPARYDVFRYIYNKQGTRWERQSVAVGERWVGTESLVYLGSASASSNVIDITSKFNLTNYSGYRIFCDLGGNNQMIILASTNNGTSWLSDGYYGNRLYRYGTTLTATDGSPISWPISGGQKSMIIELQISTSNTQISARLGINNHFYIFDGTISQSVNALRIQTGGGAQTLTGTVYVYGYRR